MGRRITRKQLKQDDEFVSAAEVIFRWIAENRRPLVAGLAAVCVVALIWWAVSVWTGNRADEASLMLRNAVVTLEGDAQPGSLVPTGNIADAEKQFQEVVSTYGGSDQADMARLYLARIALGRGEVDAARTTLVDLSQSRGDDLVGRLATLDLLDLRIASGQSTEVAAELEAVVAGQSQSLTKDLALYRLGELFVGEDDPDRARPYFERLVEEFPESPYLMNAQQKLAEIGS
jgi:predicted negative regulator of RcsB-dependent stress response